MAQSSSPSNVQRAKEALGSRLREIRQDSGMTARALAAAAGWHESKTSRIENGRTLPSDADIRVWTRLCRAEEWNADLIATARGIEGMYVEWRRLERGGLKRVQESVRPLFEGTLRFRFYQSWVVPGLLQTADYTRAVLATAVALRGAPDDVDAAVAVRMERQRVLHSGRQQFAMLVEEWVLRTVIGDSRVMAGQLDHLIAVASLPAVSLGVIPMGIERGDAWPTESFCVFDDARVTVELVSASLTVTQPREVTEYVRTFKELSGAAVYGAAARDLITAAIDALG
ncbi:helix-turn-helix domain-containing protein [Streptomyces paludis]|uniref:XRE family transcriptional regulator n=1 Tax=Streptomyces paludis TaxID=2282738 RepID=A0A345HPT5_9ACTN|nr:helix-turn-helix transcriptional regulator [Streptomyces paludis]AXG78709.1 XRE family transcriptional regulator [Streptomyces paludis]